MRALAAALLGALAGFLVGVVLNELLAGLGMLVVDDVSRLRGLRLVPALLALAGAVAGPVLDARRSQPPP